MVRPLLVLASSEDVDLWTNGRTTDILPYLVPIGAGLKLWAIWPRLVRSWWTEHLLNYRSPIWECFTSYPLLPPSYPPSHHPIPNPCHPNHPQPPPISNLLAMNIHTFYIFNMYSYPNPNPNPYHPNHPLFPTCWQWIFTHFTSLTCIHLWLALGGWISEQVHSKYTRVLQR